MDMSMASATSSMDMSMTTATASASATATPMSMSSMSMKQYFHADRGDTLWFLSWMTTSPGSFAGACIVLVVLAIVDRYLVALRAVMEMRWRAQAEKLIASAASNSSYRKAYPLSTSSGASIKEPLTSRNTDPEAILATTAGAGVDGQPSLHSEAIYNDPLPSILDMMPSRKARWALPFIPSHDIPRGALQGLQTAVHYILMLAVMTFNFYFFLCVCLGVIIGEIYFGRFCAAGHDHHGFHH